MHSRPAQQREPTRDFVDPPIVYLRTGIFVRDPARADAESTPAARNWDVTLALSILAALGGCVLGLFLSLQGSR